MSDPTAFGNVIRDLRARRDISQSTLANAAGLVQPTISRIETGATRAPEPRTMSQIINALGQFKERQDMLFETI
jgi:transcriptional regulator with XRE-family HTH domain